MRLLPKGTSGKLSSQQTEDFLQLVQTYPIYVDINQNTALVKYNIWCKTIADKSTQPDNALAAYSECDKDASPTVSKLLKIFATLSVSACSEEHSFSTLRRLKTYLRNTIGLTRLTGLASLNIHRDISVDPSSLLNELAKSNRHLSFIQ